MLPDVIDEHMVKTGTKRESVFYSFFVFFTKLSTGVGLGLSTAFLEYLFSFSTPITYNSITMF